MKGDISQVLKLVDKVVLKLVDKVVFYLVDKVVLKLVDKVVLKLVRSSRNCDNGRSHLEIYVCSAQETYALYKRLRDLDYTQVDERMAVMLNAILQLEAQGECRESATEAVLMVGYTTDGISNQEQTRWLSWNVDGGMRGFDLARNPGLSNNTEYGAGEIPLPTRPSPRSAGQSTSEPPSMIRSQQTEEVYPDLSNLKRELDRAQRERDKANPDRDGAKLERDQANLERDQAVIKRDQAGRDLSMTRPEYQQEQKVREIEANCEQ